MQRQLQTSTIADEHRKLEKHFPWNKYIIEKSNTISLSGAFWEDEEYAQRFIQGGEILGSAAQGDEVFYVGFTFKESLIGIGILNLPTGFTVPTLSVLAFLQIFPNVRAISPKAFEKDTRPPQDVLNLTPKNKKQSAALKIKGIDQISALEADFLIYALGLKKEADEGRKPKTIGDYILKFLEYAVPAATTAGLVFLNTTSLSSLARGLLTALTGAATLGASYLDLVFPLIRFLHYWATPIGFWGCTFLGTIAQLDGIVSLYEPWSFDHSWASPLLKFLYRYSRLPRYLWVFIKKFKSR